MSDLNGSANEYERIRRRIASAKTVVVKIGSSSLTKPSGHIDAEKIERFAAGVAALATPEMRIVVVSSGAIAAGFGPLGFSDRPKDVSTAQAAASVGQGIIMSCYEKAFAKHGYKVGQILITAADTVRPEQYRNVQRTLNRLLDLKTVPIVNENDALASNEIRFGDNDRLSALVANIVRADALILLTDVDGLYTAPPTEPQAKKIKFVPDVLKIIEKVNAGGTGTNRGTGGMITKLEAARVAAVSGIPAVLARAEDIAPALAGDAVGTFFAPIKSRGTFRRLWIGFASYPYGAYVADDGAAKAVLSGRASLLSAGVSGVKGEFSAGDPVWIEDKNGNKIAKGLSGFDSEEVGRTLGLSTAALREKLGEEYAHPLVHRDNLVLLSKSAADKQAA
ncbi:MAG: glutamate 5-kinase [Bifidobacteriaceae bacterium]|nr:glutamate 5-kinase [Bifidobacteriaceae bacterium]